MTTRGCVMGSIYLNRVVLVELVIFIRPRGSGVTSAVQDPSYPVYVDTSVMLGQTGEQDSETMQYSGIVYMPCTPENGFFPDYASLPRADVVYLCSPK